MFAARAEVRDIRSVEENDCLGKRQPSARIVVIFSSPVTPFTRESIAPILEALLRSHIEQMYSVDMDEEAIGYPEIMVAITAALGALKKFSAAKTQVPSQDLAAVVGSVAQLAAQAQAVLVEVTAEAEARGVVALSQAKNTAAWVADAAWHTRTTCSGTIAKAAAIAREPDLAEVWDWITATDIALSVANTVADQYRRIRHLFDTEKSGNEQDADRNRELRHGVLRQLLEAGAEHGSAQVRFLTKEIVARHVPQQFEDEHDKAARQMSLSMGKASGSGWSYSLDLDDEHRATLEAAIGPLSAPVTGPHGELDDRPVELRRAQALMVMLGRGVSSAEHLPYNPRQS